MNITVRALIFNRQKQILTVKHHGSDFWSLPGGKIEKGENLKECVIREIQEELGKDFLPQSLAFINEFQWSKNSDITTEFFFTGILSAEDISTFSGEHTAQELKQISWNTLDEKLNIKPAFLKQFSAKEISASIKTMYFSSL